MGRLEPPADDRELHVGRHVDRARHRAPEPGPGDRQPALPNIADYWPDAPHRPGAGWDTLAPVPPDGPAPRARGGSPERRRSQRPVLLTGVVALSVVVGTVLLARPLADSEIRQQRQAALPPSTIPLEPQLAVAPQPPPLLLSPTPPPPSTVPPVRAARLDFVGGVTGVTVRTADLGDEPFRVTAPDGSVVETGTSFADGVLRVGVPQSIGVVEVQLSEKITWHLRLAAGVKFGTFDMTTGTVSRIDLEGGAERLDLTLGELDRTVPVKMSGGVGAWTIRTAGQVPARVTVGAGAGSVSVYDDRRGGTGGGTVIESGDLGSGPGLDVEAVAGVGALEITRR